MTGGCIRTGLARLLTIGALMLAICPPVPAETLQKAIEAFDFEEYESAAKWLVPWAEKGEVEAQYRLGIMHEVGLGVTKNLDMAVAWYKKAAKGGHVGAQKRLQKLQKSTIAESGKESVAFDWYEQKASQGDVDAEYQLGYMYEIGWSTPKDETKAAAWYEKAAENEQVQAQLRLGLMYLAGAGVAPSNIQGSRWLHAAAEKGNKLAADMVQKVLDAPASLMLDTGKIVARVREISIKSEDKARAHIDQVEAEAKAVFAEEEAKRRAQFAKGQGIASATEQAEREDDPRFGIDAQGRKTLAWFQRHADRGDVAAQLELARRYLYGDGVDIDLQRALGWYVTAAEQNQPLAQYRLGIMYFFGIAVDRDVEAGRRWLQRAQSNGYEKAGAALSELQGKGDGGESIAVWWLRQLVDQDAIAQLQLGQMYDQGRGTAVNAEEARRWLGLAASNESHRRSQADPPPPPKQVLVAVSPRSPELIAQSGLAPERRAVPPPEAMAEAQPASPGADAAAPPAPREADAATENSLVVFEPARISAADREPSAPAPGAEAAVTAAPPRAEQPPALAARSEPAESSAAIPLGGSPMDADHGRGPHGTKFTELMVKLLDLDKLRQNWLWLLALSAVLLVTPFFMRSSRSRED